MVLGIAPDSYHCRACQRAEWSEILPLTLTICVVLEGSGGRREQTRRKLKDNAKEGLGCFLCLSIYSTRDGIRTESFSAQSVGASYTTRPSGQAPAYCVSASTVQLFISAPVARTSVSPWLYKHPWLTCEVRSSMHPDPGNFVARLSTMTRLPTHLVQEINVSTE